jgi:tetratricopeptide (TPR) repeat protein
MTYDSTPPVRPARRVARSIATVLAAIAMAAPSTAGADWAAARDAFEAGRYAEAVAELEPLAALYPEHPGTQAFLGMARIRAGDAAGAIAPLERAVADPDRPDFRLLLAWALLLDGQPDRALDHLERVSGRLPARQARASDRLLAAAAVRASDSARADRLLEAATDRGSVVPEPWIALGILARRRGDHAEAATAFERASELDPSRRDLAAAAAALRILARGRSQDERMDEALRQAVERVEGQLARPGSPKPRRRLGAGQLSSPSAGKEATDCTTPEDHDCIPGRLARDPADGGFSRSVAPPD